jgi:hypothetical protein
MAGVNVEQVMLSPLGQFLLAQNSQLPDAALQKLIGAAGFDPRRDLREILVSFNGPAGQWSRCGHGIGYRLARGTFDIPKILEAAGADGGTVETYKGVPIVIGRSRDAWLFRIPLWRLWETQPTCARPSTASRLPRPSVPPWRCR